MSKMEAMIPMVSSQHNHWSLQISQAMLILHSPHTCHGLFAPLFDNVASVDESLIINFGRINSAIQAFVAELKVLNLWNSTTVVQFSDFSRTLNPNTGDGSDHGWYGIYWVATLLLSFHLYYFLTTHKNPT
jgi:hypothetical protein